MEPTKNVSLASRLVHLDMKGAPPSVDYLQKVFPLMKKWGATGLLVEYEDTFPYDGDLEPLKCSHAYSKQDIGKIQELAAIEGFSVIPLVQTFGHLEFVLKHAEFSHLKEIEKSSMALCPSKPASLELVCSMVDQVMALHSSIEYFHIGCDEVYHLGLCEQCLKLLTSMSWSKEQLFFDHVKKIASYVKEKYPDVTCIIWDDMFRHAEPSVILNCDLGNLVEPMVWHYLPVFALPDDLWDKLSEVFPKIWIASSFKGATSPRAITTNIKYHLDNHNSWVQLLSCIQNKFKVIQGIAITGWQRYDHFAIFCEFIPTAIPSLALCLRFVEQGSLCDMDIDQVSKDLGFLSPLPLTPLMSPPPLGCSFPGSDVYLLMTEFAHLDTACREFETSDYLAVWMNDFNITRKFINPIHAEPLLTRAVFLLNKARNIEKRTDSCFEEVFSSSCVAEEWMATFLSPLIKKLESFVSKTREVISPS